MTLRIINPLPSALYHYEHSLCDTLREAGMEDLRVSSADIEAGGRGYLGRAREHVAALSASRADDAALLLWPSFGYCEVLLDALLNPRLTVVFHDARPLRRQFGMRPWHGRLMAAWPRITRPGRVLVHSAGAQQVLTDLGWHPPIVLPLPFRQVQPGNADRSRAQEGRTCLVLGQYKPARDLDMMENLPKLLPDWAFRAVGRGWPPLEGWEVVPTFVSEERMDDELRSADVVLVPYKNFFQSEVLVRAFELAKPAVTVRHEQTASLYGEDWTGFPCSWDAENVKGALVRAVGVQGTQLQGRVASAHQQSVAAWGTWARASDLLGVLT